MIENGICKCRQNANNSKAEQLLEKLSIAQGNAPQNFEEKKEKKEKKKRGQSPI